MKNNLESSSPMKSPKKRKKWSKMTPQEKMKYSEKFAKKIKLRLEDETPFLIILGNPNEQFVYSTNLRGPNKKDNIGKVKATLRYMSLVGFHLQNILLSSFLNHNPENN